MVRRMLIGLDPSEHNVAALKAACHYARLADALVLGVGVVDRPSIEHSEYGGAIGAAHYAAKAVERRLKEARDAVKELTAGFERTCAAHGVRCESHVRTGSPTEEILALAQGADLFVSGSRTFFGFATGAEADETIHQLLHTHVVPALVVPPLVEPPLRRAVIAYDSSAAAARALRTFVYQKWDRLQGAEVVLLRVDDDHDEGERALEQPRCLLEAHGFRVTSMVEPGDPTATIRATMLAEAPSLLVLGSRGRWSPLEALFGSTTRSLLETGDIPLLMAA